MNYWSAVKALVYKELRLSQVETLACLAAWPVVIGCYALAHANDSRLRETSLWLEFAVAAPLTSTVICLVTVLLFGLRELLSDATTREPIFFQMLPVTRQTFWGVKLACGLARYLAVFGLGLLVTWGWQRWLAGTQDRASDTSWATLAQVSLVIWYMACFLATVRVESHWWWRTMIVLGGLGLSVGFWGFFGDLAGSSEYGPIQLFLAGASVFVAACLVYGLAIQHSVRFRDVS
jgi:hypothetical protein